MTPVTAPVATAGSAAVHPTNAYIEWDVVNWSTALSFWRAHTAVDLSHCVALELGSRNGGLSLWLAQLGARVTCSDVEAPTDAARATHAAAGLADRINYARVDATAHAITDEYDVVMFKSVLGGLGGVDAHATQKQAVAAMHRALKPGGELFFAENLSASPFHRALRHRFVPWSRHWRYLTVDSALEFLEPFREVEYRTIGFSAAFGRNERQREFLGGLDRKFFDRLVPARWRYVIVGIARK